MNRRASRSAPITPNFYLVTWEGPYLGGVAVVTAASQDKAIALVRDKLPAEKTPEELDVTEYIEARRKGRLDFNCEEIAVVGPTVLYFTDGDY
jgi:hypothetical protein